MKPLTAGLMNGNLLGEPHNMAADSVVSVSLSQILHNYKSETAGNYANEFSGLITTL